MATSIQSQDVARDIYPIFEVDPNPDGKGPMAVGFRGTGFLLAPNLFMTCWHCLESPVADGNQLALVGSLPEAKFRASPLGEIGRDENGLDLATARVAATPSLPFSFPDRPPDYGADVAAFGYPLTETPTTTDHRSRPTRGTYAATSFATLCTRDRTARFSHMNSTCPLRPGSAVPRSSWPGRGI
jgi:hypothetical protein